MAAMSSYFCKENNYIYLFFLFHSYLCFLHAVISSFFVLLFSLPFTLSLLVIPAYLCRFQSWWSPKALMTNSMCLGWLAPWDGPPAHFFTNTIGQILPGVLSLAAQISQRWTTVPLTVLKGELPTSWEHRRRVRTGQGRSQWSAYTIGVLHVQICG